MLKQKFSDIFNSVLDVDLDVDEDVLRKKRNTTDDKFLNLETSIDYEHDYLLRDNFNVNPATYGSYGPYEESIFSDWGQCGLHPDIMKALDVMNIKKMTPIQKHSFFYLKNNYNTAIIGPSKGKSFSYVTRIISLMMNVNRQSRNSVIEPYTVVLTSSLQSCLELEILFNKLIFAAQTKKIKVIAVNPYSLEHIFKKSTYSKCDILISTPSNFSDLLNQTKLFSWSNLRHFVFDNIDFLLYNYENQIFGILDILLKMNITHNIQFISTSVSWTRDMDEFLRLLFVKWQYIFGCHLEAARYMNIRFFVVHLKQNKLKIISWYLKNTIKCGRSVLITSNTQELISIYNHFQEFNPDIDLILADGSDSTLKKWNKPLIQNQRLLVCSDDMKFGNSISEANFLLHFDIPTKKCKFEERFSFLQDLYNIHKKSYRISYVFLSDIKEDVSMIPKAVEVMKLFDEVDPNLLNLALKRINIQETEKKNLLCNELKQFGNCPKQLSCENRHVILKELDKPAFNVPKFGLAKIKILNIYDASHMCGKLLKVNSTYDSKNWTDVEDNSDIIKQELSLFYSNRGSRTILKNFKPGDMVAVEFKTKVRKTIYPEYFRAIVIHFVDKKNSKVKVKLIDEGVIKIVSKWKVLLLSDHLKKLQTALVDVFILCVKPAHFNEKWCSEANSDVKKKIISCNPVLVKIEFSLENTIWINRMHGFSSLKNCATEPILPKLLFDCGYADENPFHVNILSELIISANIDMSPSSNKIEEENCKPSSEGTTFYTDDEQKIEWANLDENIAMVSIEYFLSLEYFFLRNSSNNDKLFGLQMYIIDYIAHGLAAELKTVVKGIVALALREESDQYCRIQIREVINDTEVEVFFVDYGTFSRVLSNSLLTIAPYLITLLPFQAVECSLSGLVKSAHSGLELYDSNFKLTKDRQLQSEVVDVTLPAKYTGGFHYEVNLYEDNENINLEIQNIYYHCIKSLCEE